MNRRTFLSNTLRLAATVVGAAVLVAPLDPRRLLVAAPVPVIDPTDAWAKTYRYKTWEIGIEQVHYIPFTGRGEPDRVIKGLDSVIEGVYGTL